MYYMIGGDGREYGPVTADQLKQWLIEGRANRLTLIRADGSDAWRALGDTDLGSVTPTTGQSVRPTPPEAVFEHQGPGLAGDSMGPSGVDRSEGGLSLLRCLAAGGSFLVQNLWLMGAGSLLVWIVQMILLAIPVFGGVLHLAFDGVLLAGLFMLALRRIRGESVRVADALEGFNMNLRPLMLVGVVTQLLSTFGLLLFVLPGIYLIVAWSMALPLVADRRMEFWSAMERSRRVVSRNWFRMAIIYALAFLPVLVAVLYNFSQTFKEVAESISATGFNLDRLRGLQETANERVLLQQVVLLFALPFGTGMIAHAYEQLFGSATSGPR